jgi:peroxiredoxin
VGCVVGAAAPSFRLPDADGRLVALDELLGRTVVVLFTRHAH